MPDGCYGRLCYYENTALDRRHIIKLIRDAFLKRHYVKIFVFDFFDSFSNDIGFEIHPCTTTLVDISRPDWVPPDKKLQSQIRKAEREGVHIQIFDWTQHHRKFLELMKATEKRHDRAPRYNTRFFRSLAELACRDNRIQWIWCEHHGHPVCSHIYFIENKTLQGWQMYFDKSFSYLKPNQFVRFKMCRQAARQGVSRLNMGETPPGAEGLAYYKKRWGGKPYHYRCYVMKRGLGKYL